MEPQCITFIVLAGMLGMSAGYLLYGWVDYIYQKGNAAQQHNSNKVQYTLIESDFVDDLAKQNCKHHWIDPSNEKVQSGGWLLCTKCGLFRPPGFYDHEH